MKSKSCGFAGIQATEPKATGRYLAKFLSSFLFIGYLMVAFTENKQGLHDLLSGCLVVNRE